MDDQGELEKRIDNVVKIMAALYDKAAAYSNLIIIAGYAAFFAVWSNVKGPPWKKRDALCGTVHVHFFDLFCRVGNDKNDCDNCNAPQFKNRGSRSDSRTFQYAIEHT